MTVQDVKDWISTKAKQSKELDRLDNQFSSYITSNDDFLQDFRSLNSCRVTTTTSIYKKLIGFQSSLQSIRERLRDINIHKNKPETIQTMLESFENRLISYKNSMRGEFEDMYVEEAMLTKDIQTMMSKVEAWDSSSSSSSSNTNAEAESNKRNNQSQLADRYKRDMERQSEIGLIDKQLANLGGRAGGWDTRDHDSFLRVWSQLAYSLIVANDPLAYSITDEQRNTLIRKLSLLVVGKNTEELDEHINKYLLIKALTDKKKAVLSRWKESHVKDINIEKEIDDSENTNHNNASSVNPTMREIDRIAARDRVAKWREEKSQRMHDDAIERKCKEDQDNQLKREEIRKKRDAARAKLDQWHEIEAQSKQNIKAAHDLLKTNNIVNATIQQDLQRCRERDQELTSKRIEQKEKHNMRLHSREDRIRNMDPKLDIVEAVTRDPQRLLASTKASMASKVTVAALDEAEARRHSSRAHESFIACTGRDLHNAGRATPSWLKRS